MRQSKASLSPTTLLDYHIDFQIPGRPMGQDFEDLDLIHEFTAKIIYQPEDKGSTIGKIRGHRLDHGEAINRGASLFDACDADSQELCDVYETIYDVRTGQIREDLEPESYGDVLVVHEISITPKHRGQDLGLLALLQTIKTMGGGCALTVLKPFPLQFSGRCDETNKKEFNEGQYKLQAHWGRLGFLPIEDTDYYYLDLAYRHPETEDILRGKLKMLT